MGTNNVEGQHVKNIENSKRSKTGHFGKSLFTAVNLDDSTFK